MPHITHTLLNRKGFALISVTIVTAVVVTLALLLLNNTLMTRKAGKTLEQDFLAIQIAEAGIDKALYCLNETTGTDCGGSYGLSYSGETDITIGNGSFNTTVSVSGSSGTITSVGTSLGGRRVTLATSVTTVPPSDEMDFSYALQSGTGGANLENNSSIAGTIYSNGDIDCQGTNAVIDGDAYVTRPNGFIDGCQINYHAYADYILDSDVDGDAYYDNDPDGIAGSTVLGNAYSGQPTPVVRGLPAMDIDFWRDSAVAGGTYTGEYHPADDSTIGPLKIDGDLVFDINVTVTLMGPLWVTGNIITNNNVTIQLDPAFGADSTLILADDPDNIDGKISLQANVAILGSGNPMSHILFTSTSTSMDETDAAINVLNNASGAIFYALNGVLRLHNNAEAKSLVGSRLWIDQNAVVTYIENELSDLIFSISPGGSWRVAKGTWRRQ